MPPDVPTENRTLQPDVLIIGRGNQKLSYAPLAYIKLHYITLHYTTLRYNDYITFGYITLQCIKVQCITAIVSQLCPAALKLKPSLLLG